MRIALITGASRKEGIGYEVARQLAAREIQVVVTARDGKVSAERAAELGVAAEQVDVDDPDSVTALAKRLEERYGKLDVLINNAAGMPTYGETPSTADLAVTRRTFESTLFGTWRLTQALLPLLRRGTSARIVNVSSGGGSHADPIFGFTAPNALPPSYSVSKAALNALTVTFAHELRGTGILVNAVCPSFTATFPGAEQMGARPVKDGAASVVWAAMIGDDGPTGGFFRDGQPLAW